MSEALSVEDQKNISLNGVHAWGEAVVRQGRRMDEAMCALNDHAIATPYSFDKFVKAKREFLAERTLFLAGAKLLLAHINWVRSLRFIDTELFKELDQFESAVTTLRDHNIHVDKYLRGRGRNRDTWLHVDDDGSSIDASGTVDTNIGGRLNQRDFIEAVMRLLAKIPDHYFPRRQ